MSERANERASRSESWFWAGIPGRKEARKKFHPLLLLPAVSLARFTRFGVTHYVQFGVVDVRCTYAAGNGTMEWKGWRSLDGMNLLREERTDE